MAAAVLLHIAASCIDAIPSAGAALNRRVWQEPRVRVELDAWAQRLGIDRAAFEEELYGFAVGLSQVRAAIGAPFRPYLEATGVSQRWAMFIAGPHVGDRFEVRARSCPVDDDGCAWRTLYAWHDHEHPFLSTAFENARARSMIFKWGWPAGQQDYRRGCRVIAALAQARDPRLTTVSCRFERVPIASPHANGAVDGNAGPWRRFDREITIEAGRSGG